MTGRETFAQRVRWWLMVRAERLAQWLRWWALRHHETRGAVLPVLEDVTPVTPDPKGGGRDAG